ncbi:MAG: hypothetical protein P1U68_04180 [Verrucomicrobiales bacterium]|nr:hypothetical protein [Verrucomicrobiales bacterium]
MRLFLFTSFTLAALFSRGFSTDDQTKVPNPAKRSFPSHWDAKSWDTPAKAAFWHRQSKSGGSKSTVPAPLSPSSPPSDFSDRQPEK